MAFANRTTASIWCDLAELGQYIGSEACIMVVRHQLQLLKALRKVALRGLRFVVLLSTAF